MRRNFPYLVLICALALFASACGGGDDAASPFDLTSDSSTSESTDSSGSADSASGDSGNAGDGSEADAPAPGGPITGPLYTTGSFGLGLFAIDPASGEAYELESAVIENVDRNGNLAVVGNAAYMIGGNPRPESSFSSDLKLVKLDLATGEFSVLAELGFDRENDDAATFNSFDLVGAGGNSIYVTRRDGETNETTWHHFDATTGAELETFPQPSFDVVEEGGTCSGELRPRVMDDGSLVAFFSGLPGPVTTGAPMTALPNGLSCFGDELDSSFMVDATELAGFGTYLDGVTIDWTQVDTFYWPEVNSDSMGHNVGGFVEGDGDYWWVFEDSFSTVNFDELPDTQTLLGGVVQWDPDTNTVVNLFPLGERAGEYLGVNDNGNMEISRPSFELDFVDGRLIMVDRRDDGPTLILDPASGAFTEVIYELRPDDDFFEAELQPTREGEVWVTVSRKVIVSEDENGRSTSGEFFSDRIDPATGQVVESIKWAGL